MERRDFLKHTGLTLTGLLLNPWAVYAFPSREGEVLIPFTDQPPPSERVLLDWSQLDTFITPNNEFFNVSHYGKPEVDLASWKLEISGLVDNPMILTIDDIKARPRQGGYLHLGMLG